MTVAKSHDAYEQGETPAWAWPVHAFVAWLATIFSYIANFKRARRFKPEWRDSWEGLRQSEWLRDQLIAQGVAQLLNNEDVKLDDTKISLTPPDSFGGPCPRTPFDMNRRFLALARWAADPEAIIRERFRRLAKRITTNPLAAHGSTGALRAAHHEAACRAVARRRRVGVATMKNANVRVALILSSDRRERPSKDEGVLTKARGPPRYSLPATHVHLSAPARLRTPPRARARITAP